MKKILLIVALAFVATTISAYEFEVDGIYYEYNKEIPSFVVVSAPDAGHPYRGTVTVPDKVTFEGTTYPVNGAGVGAFAHCTELEVVDFSDVTNQAYFAPYSFDGCTGLKAFYGNNVFFREDSVFVGCTSLRTVRMIGYTYGGGKDQESLIVETPLKECTLCVPEPRLESFRNHALWGQCGRFEALKGIDYCISFYPAGLQILMSEKPEIKFEGDQMHIAFGGNKATLDLFTEVTDWWMSVVYEKLPTAIHTVAAPTKPAIRLTREGAEIVGARGKKVTVHTIDGALVEQMQCAEDRTVLPLSNRPSGIYVVNVDGTSVKVRKQ